VSGRHPFGWDYPPGVTGNEPEITGEYRDDVESGEVWPDDDDVPNFDDKGGDKDAP
jgi:hypothetical protein